MSVTNTSSPLRPPEPPPASPSGWKPAGSSPALVLLAVLAIFYTFYFAQAILLPVFLAVLLYLLFHPVVELLHRHYVPHFVGAALVLLLFAGLVGFGAYKLMAPASEWILRAPEKVQQLEEKLRSFRKPLEDISRASERVENLAEVGGEDPALTVRVRQPGWTTTFFEWANNFAAKTLLVVVLLYFLLATGDTFVNKAAALMPTWQGKQKAIEVAHRIEDGISQYLRLVTLINIGLGLATGTVMWLLGMPNPALWGVMATLLNYIPYLGAAVGIAVVFLVAVLSFETLGQALLVPAAYFALTTLEGQFITPALMGRRMHLNPVMIVLSLAFWGWIWGIGGALLAVPLLAAVKIAADHVPRLEPLARFLGENPLPSIAGSVWLGFNPRGGETRVPSP